MLQTQDATSMKKTVPQEVAILYPRCGDLKFGCGRSAAHNPAVDLKALNSVDSSFTENGLVTQINLHSSKMAHSMVSKLVLAVGRKPQLLPTWILLWAA